MRRMYLGKEKKKTVLILLACAAAGVLFFFFYGHRSLSEAGNGLPGGDESEVLLTVHVSGAVMNPDCLYTLSFGARVMDAIEAAGGAAPDADLSRLNLAQFLTDGQKLVVPFQRKEGEADTRVNINTATLGELVSLPGIGEGLASRILLYRDQHGPFSCIEELTGVSGIGEKLLEQICELITV